MAAELQPSDAADFADAMAAFAPFEPAPRLALAVSGGADSMALALLAADWLRSRGGEGVALIVDHRLRPGSDAEAVLVAQRCRDLGLRPEILTWQGPRPASAIEEAAREARYRLLEQACAHHGCLHLLTAHHAGDQHETIVLRQERASGPLGLAGMAACAERAGLRLLRPLLAWPRARLRGIAAAAGACWIDDPMNTDRRFARARLRADGLADLPSSSARLRQDLERRLVGILPGLVALDRFGVARIGRAAWRMLGPDLRETALARITLAVGGGRYGPASAALSHLAQGLDAAGPLSATLGGCLWRAGHAHVTVSREVRNLPSPMPLHEGATFLWDGRFLVRGGGGEGLAILPVAALTSTDMLPLRPLRRALGLPAAAAAVLPAIRDLEGLLAVPHLGYARSGWTAPFSAVFRPRHALSPVPFAAIGDRVDGDAQGRGALHLAC